MSLAKLVTNGPSAGAWLAPRWLACTPTLARAGLAPPPSPRGGSARAASPRSRARPALGFARRHGSPYGARHAPSPRAPARRRHRILRGSLDPVASPCLQLLQQQTQRRKGSPILGAVGSFFGANNVHERGYSHRATHQRHRDGMLTEVLEAARAGRDERQVEISESRRQIQRHLDPRKERCISGEGEPLGHAWRADSRAKLDQGPGEALQILSLASGP